jgi:hypothetical protein
MVRRRLHPEVRIRSFPPYPRSGGASSADVGRVELGARRISWFAEQGLHRASILAPRQQSGFGHRSLGGIAFVGRRAGRRRGHEAVAAQRTPNGAGEDGLGGVADHGPSPTGSFRS